MSACRIIFSQSSRDIFGGNIDQFPLGTAEQRQMDTGANFLKIFQFAKFRCDRARQKGLERLALRRRASLGLPHKFRW